MKSLKISFQNFCKINNFELNPNQIEIINALIDFLYPEKKFSIYYLKKKFFMFLSSGNVGVGKIHDFKFCI